MSLDGRDVPHWAREHVNPMVALRNILCSDRWEQDWPQIAMRLREGHLKECQQRQRRRRLQRPVVTPSASATLQLAPPPTEAVNMSTPQAKAVQHPKAKQLYRPAANHPWRHSPIGRARFKPYRSGRDPKP